MSESESESRETVADIVAEMRYGTIPKHRTDHELLALYADRIEAIDSADAWRSLYTPGNAAAMREALELCVKEMCNYCRNEAIAPELELTCVDGCEAYKIAQAALSKPPRNCDRFADETDAQLAFLGEVWLISVDRESMLERDRYENWTDEMRARYGQWLLAPAQEGGAK